MVSTRRSAAATLKPQKNTLSTKTKTIPNKKVKKIKAISTSTSMSKAGPAFQHSVVDAAKMTKRFESEEPHPLSTVKIGTDGPLLNTSTTSGGTSANPIELGDSPISQSKELPKRKFQSFIDLEDATDDGQNTEQELYYPEQKRLRPNEPHQFARNRPGFFKGNHTIDYDRVSPSRNPNPNAFTGHRELDMYRMARARSGAASGPHGHSSSHARMRQPSRDNVANAAHPQPRKKESKTAPKPMPGDRLRSESVRLRPTQGIRPFQYVSHPGNFIRNSPYDYRPAYTQHGFPHLSANENRGAPLPPWSRRQGPAFYQAPPAMPPEISQLQATTSHLAQLLAFYPACEEPARLIRDITALVHAQFQQVSAWQVVENARPPRHASVTTLSIDSAKESPVTTPPPPPVPKKARTSPKLQQARTQQDDDVRQYMSSRANIWKDVDGQSLAEVYATKSSPAPKTDSQLSQQTEPRRNSLPPTRGESKARRGRYERY